jgi:glyoxylase-like metal-dependent hydrolase (beta-lactamase superfamily II)
MSSAWECLEEGVYRFRDSCHVYAVQGPEGTVLVNAGTGRAADHLDAVARNRPVTVLLTHHFRDHTDGAIRLRDRGATVIGPYWEQEYLIDPEQHFRERQHWNSYDNRWDRFSPVRALPVTDWMMDYETRRIAGLAWEVVPTPGVTNGASSYLVTLGTRRIGFAGEVICGDGKTTRLAPLQYNYNDFTGAYNLYHSAHRLLLAHTDRLLPSLGEPVDRPVQAIAALKANLRRLSEIQRGADGPMTDPDEDDIEEVLPHLYRSKYAVAHTHFVLSESGKALSIDYGYNVRACFFPGRHHLSNRRPCLHGLGGLKKRFGIDRIDTVLVSHFHDDHINGIAMLQRLFGTQVWAGRQFSDLLERPARYDRPCLWHEPIPVAHAIPNGATVYWENIPITLHPMSGHTRFATLICMTVDGTRVVHTGDQIFFNTDDGLAFKPGAPLFTNHVYKNGLDLGCYKKTLEDLRRFQPELVLTGHTLPYRTSPAWYEAIERGANAFDELHRTLMLLDDDGVHFGAESQGGKLKPYRAHAPAGGPVEFEGWVLNPFPTPQPARLTLVGPAGWQSETVQIDLGPREQKEIRIAITPPPGGRCRRQPVGLDLIVGDRPFGQVAEALVTVGLPRW